MALGYQGGAKAAAKKTFGGAPAAAVKAAPAAELHASGGETTGEAKKGRKPDYRIIQTDAEGNFIKGEDGYGVEIAAGWSMPSGQIRFNFPDGGKAVALQAYSLVQTDDEGQFVKDEQGNLVEVAVGRVTKSGQIRLQFADGGTAIAQPAKKG